MNKPHPLLGIKTSRLFKVFREKSGPAIFRFNGKLFVEEQDSNGNTTGSGESIRRQLVPDYLPLRTIMVVQHRRELKDICEQHPETLGLQYVVNSDKKAWVQVEGLRLGKVLISREVLIQGLSRPLYETLYDHLVFAGVNPKEGFQFIG